MEVVMAEETADQKLARLEAENLVLREQMEQRKPGQLRLKVSEKGGLSVYGLGRFPVTLYKEQWVRLLDHVEEIKKFLQDNDSQLKAKQ
jgi:superfamily II helicase